MKSDQNSFSDKFYQIETPLTWQLSCNESETISIIYLYIIIIIIIIIIITIIIIIFSGSAAQRGLWAPRPRGFLITHNDAPQSVGLLRTSDQLVAETST
jgi:hypothetical protein